MKTRASLKYAAHGCSSNVFRVSRYAVLTQTSALNIVLFMS